VHEYDFVGKVPPEILETQSLLCVKIVQTAAGDNVAILLNSTNLTRQRNGDDAPVPALPDHGHHDPALRHPRLLIARRVSKPIEDINKSAKKLRRAINDIQYNGKGFREIGELSIR
jgi:hypothetical protein